MKKILICGILFSTLLALPVFAADFYVDGDSGDDAAGVGTATAPYKTITKAVSVMAGGDTIYCRGTVIDSSITIPSAISGTALAYTTITSWPNYSCTINANGNNNVFISGDNSQYIKISNLHITNAVVSAFYLENHLGESSYWEISNNNIYGFTGGNNAMYIVLAFNNHSVVSGNDIDGDGSNAFGIYFGEEEDLIIEKNKIHDLTSFGIGVEGGNNNIIIRNNWVYNMGGRNYLYLSGVLIVSGSNFYIYNNTFYKTFDSTNIARGIMLYPFNDHDLHDVYVKNNIIYKSNYGLAFSAHLTNTDNIYIDYNDYYNTDNIATDGTNNYSTLVDWRAATSYDDNSQTNDPLLTSIEPTLEDFHLQDSSPCIDAGTNVAEVLSDYDVETRPYNITDIGADERPIIGAIPISMEESAKVKIATITWEMSDTYPVTGYFLQNSTDPALIGAADNIYTTTIADLTNLTPAQTYYYALAAYYETAYHTYVSEYTDIFNYSTKPSKVRNVKIVRKSANKVLVKWTKQRRVDGYLVKLRDKHGVIKIYNIKSNKARKYITNLVAGKRYYVKVRAYLTFNSQPLYGRFSKAKQFKI